MKDTTGILEPPDWAPRPGRGEARDWGPGNRLVFTGVSSEQLGMGSEGPRAWGEDDQRRSMGNLAPTLTHEANLPMSLESTGKEIPSWILHEALARQIGSGDALGAPRLLSTAVDRTTSHMFGRYRYWRDTARLVMATFGV